VAVAVCRNCYTSFENKLHLDGHVKSKCSTRALETPENFNLENFVNLEEVIDEKDRDVLRNVWKKYGILKLAFCDRYFPRLQRWQSLQSIPQAEACIDQQPEEQLTQALIDPPNERLGHTPRRPGSPSALERMVHEQELIRALFQLASSKPCSGAWTIWKPSWHIFELL
jgi:hypothetical protein